MGRAGATLLMLIGLHRGGSVTDGLTAGPSRRTIGCEEGRSLDIEGLVPATIRERGGSDLERARLVVWFSLGLLLTGVGMIPVLAITYNGWSSGLVMALVEIGLLGAVLVVLRASGSPRYAGLLLCGQLLILLTFVGMRGNQLDVAASVIFPAVPLIAIFTAGRERGRYMAVLACAVLALFLALHVGGMHESDAGHFITFFIIALTVLLTTALAVAYDRTRDGAERTVAAAIEELRRANRELELARDAAEAGSRAKNEFLARMSHEIRTPIHGVLGMNQLLLESPLNEEQREFVTAIKQSARSLSAVVEDVLDFSRIEAGKTSTKTVDFDLRRVVEAAVGVVSQGASHKGLELSALVDPTVPHQVPGDPDRVQQILVNLLGNAVKYTEAGEIALRCRVQADRPGPEIVFTVHDTGVGLPDGQQQAIFEPFTQVDSFITRPQPGSGLGLAICRELVTLLGGRIGVESRVDQGSSFWFTIPVPGLQRHRSPQPLRGLRGLCLDDNESANEVPATLLKAWGMEVTVCSDGAEAVTAMETAVARDRPFDMAMLDIRMPGMDGMEVAGVMADRAHLRSTPAVLVMPFGQSIEIGHLGKLKTARVSKPLHERHLGRTLQNLLEGQQMEKLELRTLTGNAPLRSVGAAPGQEGRILIVDDNPVARDLASKIVERLGHEVAAASDGRQAVDLVVSQRFDLVLMDCQMPGMTGYEAAQEIRHREGEGRRTPIVAMTAHAMGDERERCLEVGMDDYLSKPFLPRQLAAMVSRWIATEDPSP